MTVDDRGVRRRARSGGMAGVGRPGLNDHRLKSRHTSADFIDFLSQRYRAEGEMGQANPHRAGQSMRPEDESRRAIPAREPESAVPFHADLLFLAQPGRALVCQDPARRHRPRRFHFRVRSGAPATSLHPCLREIGPPLPLDLCRSATTHPY